MNQPRLLRTLAILLCFLLIVPLVQASTPTLSENLSPPVDAYVPGELLVIYKSELSAQAASETLGHVNGVAQKRMVGRLDLVTVPLGSEDAAISMLGSDPRVDSVARNGLFYASGAPNDPLVGNQWGYTLINAGDAADLEAGSASITIAILDSGVDLGHPDLASRLVAGYDFVDDDADPSDENGHGTHVAGIAGAVTNNGVGVAGVDRAARIMPVRVLNELAGGSAADIVAGMEWAADQGADVINLSLVGSGNAAALQLAVGYAISRGATVVAAMGNFGDAVPQYPAACNDVIAVASVKQDDTWANTSYGPHCDLAAPGGWMGYYHDPAGVYSTMPTYAVYKTDHELYYNNYDYLYGSSQAAPHVSGVVALLLAADPTLTYTQIEQIIESTSHDVGDPGWDEKLGAGRLDAYAALASVVEPKPVTDLWYTFASEGSGFVTLALAWSPPVNVTALELRYSDQPLDNGNWASGTVIDDDVAPDGAPYLAIALPYTTRVYVAARGRDAQARWSDVSNNAFWPVNHQVMMPFAAR